MNLQGGASVFAAWSAAHWRWHTLDATRLAAFQARRVRALVRWVDAHSPLYHEHWSGHDLAQWRTLPPVDRSITMAHFEDWNTYGVSASRALQVALAAERGAGTSQLEGLTVGLSSGTSGQRGLFLVSPAEQHLWAGTILARALHRPGPTRIAFFLRANSRLYEQLGSRFIQFRYFDLLTPLDETVAVLNQYNPTVVVAPPSLLDTLAARKEAGEWRTSPERVISVAEVLEPQVQARLEARFGVRVEQIYQATEGLFAITCPRGRLHIQEDVVLLECESLGEGRFAPIVTDLWRRTQPIVRYRLDDILTWSEEPCPCGSPFRVIEQIEGRRADLCYFEGGRGRITLFPDQLRRAILLPEGRLRDYRAVQRADNALDVTLEFSTGVNPTEGCCAVQRQLRDMLASLGCHTPHLHIKVGVETQPATEKVRRVRRIAPPCE